MSLQHHIYQFGSKEFRVYQANEELVSLGFGHKLRFWYYCEVGHEGKWFFNPPKDSAFRTITSLFKELETPYQNFTRTKPTKPTKSTKKPTKLTDLPVVNLPKKRQPSLDGYAGKT